MRLIVILHSLFRSSWIRFQILHFQRLFHADISLSAVASVEATSSFLFEGIRRSTIDKLCHQKWRFFSDSKDWLTFRSCDDKASNSRIPVKKDMMDTTIGIQASYPSGLAAASTAVRKKIDT